MKKQTVYRFDTESMETVKLLTEKHIRQGERVVSLAITYRYDSMFMADMYTAILITESRKGVK